MLAMIWISGVSFLWEAIDAGYRGHTSISTGNRELDGHSRFIIPRPSLRARKIRCHLASRPSRSIFSPASRSTVCPFRSQPQEPLHKWPCPSFKITLETTDDHQGRPASPFRPSLSSIQLPPPFPFLSVVSFFRHVARCTDILDSQPFPLLITLSESLDRACKEAVAPPRAIKI